MSELNTLTKLQQAHALLHQNKAEAAQVIVQRLMAKEPGNPDINSLMGMISLRMGKLEQAEYFCRKSVSGPAPSAVNLTNLGIVLIAGQKDEEGIAALKRANEVQPSYNEARLAMCNILMDKHRIADVLAICEEAMKYERHAQVCVTYSAALISLGENHKAVEFLNQATQWFPNEAYLAGARAMAYEAQYGADPEVVAQAHRDYGLMVNRIKPPFRSTYVPKKDPERRLRIGFVSPDFRRHSVAYFIEPLFEHYDRDRLDLVCYYTNRSEDEVTARFKKMATLWRDCSAKIEVQIGQMMADDRIDIAVDLAGHTDGNSLLAFALRLAPVQATYIGYPDTTGLTQMDYRIIDSYTDPVEPAVRADARATEKLYRMDPCFLCYRPPNDAPAPFRDPKFPGPVFGSFNASRKHNAGTIALWSRLLKEMPGSKLILKAQDLNDPEVPRRLMARFASNGIGPGRVEFLAGTKTVADHLALYSRIDVGLDPMPYQGTTTTCEAMWMGVPVVTHAGQTHAGRVGVSLLHNVQAPELIAKDDEDFLRIAKELAADPQRQAMYRSTLRERVARSALCDRVAFCRRMEAAFREMWRAYCATP